MRICSSVMLGERLKTGNPESRMDMKTKRELARLAAVLMAVLMVFSLFFVAGCDGAGRPKEKPKTVEAKKSPEQLAAEQKS